MKRVKKRITYTTHSPTLSLSFLLSDTQSRRLTLHSATDEAPNMASHLLFSLLLSSFLQPFRILHHAPLRASSAAVPSRRRRLLGAPLRRAGEDRRLLRRPQPPRGVTGVPRLVRGAAAAAGGHGAAPLGEALQARPPWRRPQPR